MKPLRWAAALLAGLVAAGCGQKDVAGSTDIGNPDEVAVSGFVMDPGGVFRAGAEVGLYPTSYVPPTALTKASASHALHLGLTDSAGSFYFQGVAPGAYNLVVRTAALDSSLLKPMTLMSVQESAGACTLYAAGTLSIYAIADAGQGNGAVGIYLPGSPFGVKSTDSAATVLTGLPAGDHAIVFRGDSGSALDSFHITSADTTYAAPVAVAHDTLLSLPPVVLNVQAHLNAAQDTIYVRWMDPHATGNTFLVYRQFHGDTVGHPINGGHFNPVTGQPGYFEYLDPRSSIPTPGPYVYWVRQQDTLGRMGEPGHSLVITIP